MISDKPPFALRTVIIVAVGGWVVWGLFALLVAFGFAKNEAMTVAGQIGDLFGGINALFSALAFAMVWWAGDMQRRELSLQRQDLSLQLEELKAQRDELVETRNVFKRQNFESTFFQQLSLLRDMLPHFRSGDHQGEAALLHIASFCARIAAQNPSSSELTDEEYKDRVAKAYMTGVYSRHGSQLGAYFRTLYHTFKLLDGQDFSEGDKIRYANLLRAQIGSNMLVIISVNLLSPVGVGLLDLATKYRLLKHFPSVESERIKSVLPAELFLGRD